MNKRHFLTAFLFISITATLLGQLSVGFISGASLSKYKMGFIDDESDAYFTTSPAVGFHAGVTMNIPFSESFGLHPSIMFSQKGNKLSYVKANSTNESQNYQSNHTINYVEVPLLFKYNIGGESMGLSLMAGPNLGFAIGGKLSERGNLEFYSTDNGSLFLGKINENKDVKIGNKVNSNYRNFDAGFAMGLGGYFNIGETGQLVVEVRWAVGGSNILNANYTHEPTYDAIVVDNKGIARANVSNNVLINNPNVVGEVRNRSTQFSIGYLFKFNEKY
jgi:Outer membrane protein beta-barrel domain